MSLREITVRVLLDAGDDESGAFYAASIEDALVDEANSYSYVIDATGNVEVISVSEAYSKGYNNDMLMRYLRIDQDGHKLWGSAEEAMQELYGEEAGEPYLVKESENTPGMELWATDPDETEVILNSIWLVRLEEVDRWRKATPEEIQVEGSITRTLTRYDD